MAIKINFNGMSTGKPGAYSRTLVNLTGGFPIAPTGVVAIIGEAEGGEPGSSAGVQTYTSEDIASLAATYKSGPIVDAARMLIAPARDARVPNGASMIRVYKTNASLKASLNLPNAAPATLFQLSSRNYGSDENLINVTVVAGTVSASARIITVNKGDLTEVLSENPRDAQISIQYTGTATAAAMTIQNGLLIVTTSAPSVPADDLSITLAGKTIKQLKELIDAHASYTASTTLLTAATKSAADLDPISTSTSVLSATVLYAQQKELLDIINAESSLISATRVANVEGTIAALAKTFMSGAAKGASTNSLFQAGFDALLAFRCNTIVPLLSRDASALATEGLTDAGSTFTVDAVNLQAVTHCLTASNTRNRSERNCYVSVKRSFANSRIAAKTLAEARASMLFQDVQILGSDGNLKYEDPWAASCLVAGVQAGTPVGTPPTFKYVNVNGIRHQDYNAKTQIDLAIDDGLLPLESVDSGGFRIVVGNTTYGKDANFVYNRISVLEAADNVAYNLRQQLEAIFIGEKARTGTEDALANTVIAIMSTFLREEIIVGDDTNGGLGWKDLTVNMTGNTAFIDITITPVQGVDFILPTITLDNIRASA